LELFHFLEEKKEKSKNVTFLVRGCETVFS